MNFKNLILEDEDLSDVDVEEGKMSDILGVPEDETIADGYDGSPKDAAQEIVDAVGESEAASMINYAANISGDEFLEDMQDAIKNIDEQFRGVVRSLIKQELSEMTTTAAGGGYQTPFAFGDEDDEEKEDDIEEFLDTYGWEMAELAKKAREGSLTEAEREKVRKYIDRVRSMRDSDVESYDKKSNYYPMQENFTEEELERWAEEGAPEDLNVKVKSPSGGEMGFKDYLRKTLVSEKNGGPIVTKNHILKVHGAGGELELSIFRKRERGALGQHVVTVELGEKASSALHQSIMSKV